MVVVIYCLSHQIEIAEKFSSAFGKDRENGEIGNNSRVNIRSR